MSKSRHSRRAEAARQKKLDRASRPRVPKPSLSRGLQAARSLDGFHPLRSALAEVAAHKGEWAGLPMPLEGQRLIVEPSYPYAEGLMKIGEKHSVDDGWRLRNVWWSWKWRCEIYAMENPQGRVVHGKIPAFHHITQDLGTLGCSEVWGLEQEHRALQLLGGMLRHRALKQYILTGMFLERSKRSGVTYLFRRLKPTVALAPARGPEDQQMRILCCLCLHPIAYYASTWAGAMCPTDDVIAHLSLMRGDEAMFWKRANQIQPFRPEAGL